MLIMPTGGRSSSHSRSQPPTVTIDLEHSGSILFLSRIQHAFTAVKASTQAIQPDAAVLSRVSPWLDLESPRRHISGHVCEVVSREVSPQREDSPWVWCSRHRVLMGCPPGASKRKSQTHPSLSQPPDYVCSVISYLTLPAAVPSLPWWAVPSTLRQNKASSLSPTYQILFTEYGKILEGWGRT